ncbi:cytochrome c [Sulfuriferula sp.]|uniref:cytochrome c n=1 Tax=Sulfuriferula sp. TaxID=2025307 RepID=UPI00272FA9B7|nr:cytochrome c [Sulfuriferula sp.]MDP2026155.1 cytochrome c [Sulfuriferula sp.]
MKRALTAVVLLTVMTSVNATPFEKGDPKIGKTLVDKSCLSCHAQMFGGDGSKIYTRADRKVKTPQQLAARVATCNANTGANWFPEDEMHVDAYLNQQYYKFK